MQLFETDDYREAIKQIVDDRKKSIKDLTYQEVARACRVQKGYFSRVLQKQADLSRDQLFLFCDAVHLDQEKRNYLFLLHDHNRCGVKKRKSLLETELRQLQEKHGRTEHHIRHSHLVNEELSPFTKYYLETDTQLVHMFLTIERFRRDLSLIEKSLRCSSQDVHRHLARLEELELIKLQGESIEVLQDELHLSAEHPIFPVYRTMMRVRAMAKIQETNDGRNYSYSAVLSAKAGAREHIKKRFLSFLKDLQNDLGSGKVEDVFQLNFDVFSWSG